MARTLTRPAAALAALQILQWAAVAALAGSTDTNAGAGLLVLQLGLLLPLVLVSVYTAATEATGRAVGLWAAAVWALGPFAVVPLWDARYDGIYRHRFLAPLVGLADEPGFRAMALAAVAVALAVVAARRGRLDAAAGAGLAASAAAALDARAVVVLGVPALVLLLARRGRLAAAALGAALPGVVALAIGDGQLPSLPTAASRWSHLDANELGFQEYFWSMRVLQWLPLAGAVGLARRSVPLAAALLAYVAGFFVVVGSSFDVSFGAGTFLPALIPAAPAYLLLSAGVVLLVPPLPRPARLVRSSASS